MLRHHEEYSFDPGNVFVWGDSSGGHTAVMTALTAHDPRLLDEDGDTQPLPIRGCIDYYGPVLISTMNHEPSTQDHVDADSPEGMFLGGVRVDEHEKEAFLASPLAYLQKGKVPPMLIVHGSRDRLVPFGQSCLLFDALQKKRVRRGVLSAARGRPRRRAVFFPRGLTNRRKLFARPWRLMFTGCEYQKNRPVPPKR